MATHTDTYQAAQNNTNLTAPGPHSNGHNGPMEKDFENGYHLDNSMDPDTALRKIQTSGSISISPELFEKIYLSPKNQVSNNIRSTFANPTPLALVGFLLSLTPLSNILMGWQGSGGLGAATIGTYWFFGGLLMVIGSLLEFVLGNTFPFVVFGSFGAFWLTFGATLTPYFNASGAYDPQDPTAGAASPVFLSSFAFFQVYMGILCFVYLIISIRTNLVFFLIFLLLIPAFGCLAGYFFTHGTKPVLLTAAGALTFIICLLGWYLFFVQLLAAVDFPLNLPVGDLSRYVKGASEKKNA